METIISLLTRDDRRQQLVNEFLDGVRLPVKRETIKKKPTRNPRFVIASRIQQKGKIETQMESTDQTENLTQPIIIHLIFVKEQRRPFPSPTENLRRISWGTFKFHRHIFNLEIVFSILPRDPSKPSKTNFFLLLFGSKVPTEPEDKKTTKRSFSLLMAIET